MPINLQGSGNIAEGWGPPPQLHAPNISGVLGEILQQRRYQEALTQKNIAGAIKQMQEQRQNQAYLEAMQKAGILPEGDYGALGAEGASDLAKQILAKKVADARAQHLLTTGSRGRGGGSGSGGGGGGGGKDWQGQETWWDSQGREWREGPGGRPIPVKPAAGTKAGEKPTDLAKAVKERMGLQDQFDTLEADRLKQEANDRDVLKQPNVPFKQSDLYNLTRNRLKQLEQVPGMPSTAPPSATPAPGASPTPPSADSATGHAEGYGKTVSDADVEALTWARAHPDDPRSAAILDKLGVPH